VTYGLVSTTTTSTSRTTTEAPIVSAPTRQGRLLAAKHRAARR
jgi:hypothetical protein